MDILIKKPNLLYLIFVRKCYNLKFWLRPLHRNKLIKAITVCIVKPNVTKWYIKPYDKLIRHREDGPARIWSNDNQIWCINGKIHREYGPAVIRPDGTQKWYINGELHREDGPGIIRPSGSQYWYKNDKLHREDGPAIIMPDGKQYWYKYGIALAPF